MKRLFAALALTHAVVAWSAPPVTKLTTLHTFHTTDGAMPIGSLVEGEDGTFYGVTAYGGTREGGTVFKVTSAGVFTSLYNFARMPAAIEGEAPMAGLVRGADGAFYGTTRSGGRDGYSNDGTLFRITPAGVLTVVRSFEGDDGRSGGSLMLASDGNFYGTTEDGGAHGGGTIYRLAPNGTLTVLHAFAGDATEVGYGISRLVEGPGMVLYATSLTGGYTVPDIEGTFFSLAPNGAFTVLHRFSAGWGRPTGVAFGADGLLYGSSFHGSGFSLTTGGTFTHLHQLLGCSCGTPFGGQPAGAFYRRGDGNFYGVTTGGGLFNWGTIYSMSPAGVVEPIHSFNGTDEGMQPSAALIEGRDGRLYGATSGFNTAGTVFKLAFLPEAPASLTATTSTDGGVTLIWSDVRSVNTYNLYRGTVSGGLDATPMLTGLTARGVKLLSLPAGVAHYFAVAAVNEAGIGPRSSEVSATPTPPPAPPSPPAPAPSGGGGGALDGWMLAVLLLCAGLGVRRNERFPGRRVLKPLWRKSGNWRGTWRSSAP